MEVELCDIFKLSNADICAMTNLYSRYIPDCNPFQRRRYRKTLNELELEFDPKY